MEMNTLDKISTLLLVIGGLNWGLVGFFEYNLVDEIFGAGETLSRIIYAVVGLAALYCLYKMFTAMNTDTKKD
jgi:uncharacterized protein